MSLDVFLADVEALRSGAHDFPVEEWRLRWQRRRSGGPIVSSDLVHTKLTIHLYPYEASHRQRAMWSCLVDPMVSLDHVEQGATCVVTGEVGAGRGIEIAVGGVEMLTTYPLSHPLRGPRLGRSAEA